MYKPPSAAESWEAAYHLADARAQKAEATVKQQKDRIQEMEAALAEARSNGEKISLTLSQKR